APGQRWTKLPSFRNLAYPQPQSRIIWPWLATRLTVTLVCPAGARSLPQVSSPSFSIWNPFPQTGVSGASMWQIRAFLPRPSAVSAKRPCCSENSQPCAPILRSSRMSISCAGGAQSQNLIQSRHDSMRRERKKSAPRLVRAQARVYGRADKGDRGGAHSTVKFSTFEFIPALLTYTGTLAAVLIFAAGMLATSWFPETNIVVTGCMFQNTTASGAKWRPFMASAKAGSSDTALAGDKIERAGGLPFPGVPGL